MNENDGNSNYVKASSSRADVKLKNDDYTEAQQLTNSGEDNTFFISASEVDHNSDDEKSSESQSEPFQDSDSEYLNSELSESEESPDSSESNVLSVNIQKDRVLVKKGKDPKKKIIK